MSSPAIDAEYVRITINGQLLLPSIQYRVTPNKKYVKIDIPIAQNDVVELIHFAVILKQFPRELLFKAQSF